jgi:hypothetical protein
MVSWYKLETFIRQFWESAKRETGFEWFQWLAERIMERERGPSSVPAYIRHKNWKG